MRCPELVIAHRALLYSQAYNTYNVPMSASLNVRAGGRVQYSRSRIGK